MAVAAVGIFDGVHLGHRKVMETLVRTASGRGDRSLVVTFLPHPRAVLQNDADSFRLLTSMEERTSLLKALGVDDVVVLPFTREFAAMKASDFIRMLAEDYSVNTLVLGYDTRMGADQLDAERLSEVAGSCGVDTVKVGALGEDFISSSKIRAAVSEGDVRKAAAMLGRPYSLHGVVVSGNRIGRTIGFPTANMQMYEPLKLIPAGGVYAVEVETCGCTYGGMTNIGMRPTVGQGGGLTVETFIFDFDSQIYGLDITVSFLDRVRDEKAFQSLDALRLQLEKDEIECRKLIIF